MDLIISIVFIVFILLFCSKRLKSAKEDANLARNPKAAPVMRNTATMSSASRRKNVSGSYSKSAARNTSYVGMKSGKSYSGSTLRDDRNNDWLANQLRDEHRAFKEVSDMFGLKIEHAAHCDARLLRNYHHLNCDARGVDTAQGK